MADESVSSETNPETQPSSPPPVVAAPPSDDAKSARLEAELAQTKQALGEVAEMVKSGKLTLAPDSPKAEVEEDDTHLVDRKELKKRERDMVERVAGAIQYQSASVARLARENTKENLRGKLKNFDKYEGEIIQRIGTYAPQAARADTIRKVHKVVAAEHSEEVHGEVAAEAVQRERERLRARGIEIPEDDEDDEIAPTGRIPGAMASPARSPVAPAGDASVGRFATRNRDVSIKPLSPEERVAAGIFGIKDAAEWRKYGDKNWRPDLLGSKGRQKF